MPKRFAHYLELGLLAVGLALLAVFVAFRIHGSLASQAALENFAALKNQVSGASVTGTVQAQSGLDFGMWSEKRVAAYKASLAVEFETPMAVLSVPRLGLQVPVFDGTEELVLNRGVGRIIGTARPGESGNIGIAGHRDGFFRCLKDIHVGDEIELDTPSRKAHYLVDTVEIVQPDDVHVLQPRAQPALTLVTCYPFYYVGSAPQRYIVHASITPDGTTKADSGLNTTKGQEAIK
jgi:sortase A